MCNQGRLLAVKKIFTLHLSVISFNVIVGNRARVHLEKALCKKHVYVAISNDFKY